MIDGTAPRRSRSDMERPMMLQRVVAGLENARALVHRGRSTRRAAPADSRWAVLIPPLLCALLADLCLVLLPFRPLGDHLLNLRIVSAIIGAAVVWELFLGFQQYRQGFIELRAIRIQGTERPAFIAPISPHFYVVPLLLSLWLIGMSLDLVLLLWVHARHSPGLLTLPAVATAREYSLICLFALPLGFGLCLRRLFRSTLGVAVLGEGVWLHQGTRRYFLPWDSIEAVSALRLPLLAGLSLSCVGVRLLTLEPLGTSPRVRRRLERIHAVFGWHLLVFPVLYTISSAQLADLLQMYLADPKMRARIGAAGELARVRRAAATGDRTAAPSSSRAAAGASSADTY
jgi:hypothetical protein